MRELSSSFAAAPEVAARVPSRHLYTGARMPAIGFGTFGSDHASADAIPAAVRGAIEEGYRHIDCAAVYMNEDRIGQVLRDLFRAGLQREEMWITSKLWTIGHSISNATESLERPAEVAAVTTLLGNETRFAGRKAGSRNLSSEIFSLPSGFVRHGRPTGTHMECPKLGIEISRMLQRPSLEFMARNCLRPAVARAARTGPGRGTSDSPGV
jgi:hypothetical protein